MSNDLTITSRFVFFWHGWPSQWHRSAMVIDGVHYNCPEQFMMAEKARVFRDEWTLQAILRAHHPREQKALGRKVANFDQKVWDSVCRGIVHLGNLAKFEQNVELWALLDGTGDRLLVEASPEDCIWGIGLSVSDERAFDPKQWRGKNWLGQALTEVRAVLRGHKLGTAANVSREIAEQLETRRKLLKVD